MFIRDALLLMVLNPNLQREPKIVKFLLTVLYKKF